MHGLTTGETIADFAARWLEDFPRPAVATMKTYGVTVAPFIRAYGDRRMDDISPAEAARWATSHQNQVACLKIFYNDAMHGPPGMRAASYNPFARVRVRKPPTRADHVAPTMAEVMELADLAIEVLPDVQGFQMRALLLMGFFGLLRPGEMAGLDHRHVDIDRRRVRVERTMSQWEGLRPPKGGHVRDAPLPPAALAAYLEVPRHPRLPHVFWTATGKRPTARSIHNWWLPVRAAWAARDPDRRDPKLVFYVASRHAGITHLVEVMGVNSDRVALLAGHHDGGKLVRTLYSHRDSNRALDAIQDAWTVTDDDTDAIGHPATTRRCRSTPSASRRRRPPGRGRTAR
jgi:integrase